MLPVISPTVHPFILIPYVALLLKVHPNTVPAGEPLRYTPPLPPVAAIFVKSASVELAAYIPLSAYPEIFKSCTFTFLALFT